MAIGKFYHSELKPQPATKLTGLGNRRSPLRRVPVNGEEAQAQPNPAPRLRSALVSETANIPRTSVRTLSNVARLGIDNETPEQPAEEVYYVPWAPGMALSKKAYSSAMAHERERQEQAQREANRRAHEARVAEARRIDDARRAELLRTERAKRTAAVENTLLRSQLENLAKSYDLNETDVKLVMQRIDRAGLAALPVTWDDQVQKYLDAKREAGL